MIMDPKQLFNHAAADWIDKRYVNIPLLSPPR